MYIPSFLLFIWSTFTFLLYECPGLCRLRPGHSLCKNIMQVIWSKISGRKDLNQYFFLLFALFFVNVEHCDKASLPGSPRKKFYRRLSIRQLMTRHFGSNDDLSLHKKQLFAQAHQITKANGGDFSRCHSYEYRVESYEKKYT